jgi:hypothetical protein
MVGDATLSASKSGVCEDIWAENNVHLFDYKIPIASKADF